MGIERDRERRLPTADGFSNGKPFTASSLVKEIRQLKQHSPGHSFKRRHGIRHTSERRYER